MFLYGFKHKEVEVPKVLCCVFICILRKVDLNYLIFMCHDTQAILAIFQDLGLAKPGSLLGNLTFVCDNCEGQNNNKTMIKFMVWLTECSFAEAASLIFLIKGRTKNICNQCYNLVKITYHKNYIQDQLDGAISTSNSITVHCLTEGWFKNVDKWQSEVFDEPTDGSLSTIYSLLGTIKNQKLVTVRS